ncbi:MAG: hypothetical protein ACK4NP_01715 [Parvularculaceae bacterium]
MVYILELLAVVIFGLIAFNIWKSVAGGRPKLPAAKGTALSPGRQAADALAAFDNVRADLKAHYPATFAMLGGYMNAHTIAEAGGVDAALREMISDWAPRREEVARELTRLLAENESEDELRAILAAACDLDLGEESVKAFLARLLSKISD